MLTFMITSRIDENKDKDIESTYTFWIIISEPIIDKRKM